MHLTTFVHFEDGEILAILPNGRATWNGTMKVVFLSRLLGRLAYWYEALLKM